ncbi:DNA recombination protein RmuC [Pseudomonas matsuisoli]|uniref:DNA recombination protein RmuC n=1 Tax=Pseudomonas matsuisoli TaxID=1515666 RepID=A0A917UR75_9PSED|nr:DNA recombination protein RmuC [Pseudomonas matsuisoli]GGJ78316.1 DNA recombination protein RmuC [Pseudomonas matsuisoli]
MGLIELYWSLAGAALLLVVGLAGLSFRQAGQLRECEKRLLALQNQLEQERAGAQQETLEHLADRERIEYLRTQQAESQATIQRLQERQQADQQKLAALHGHAEASRAEARHLSNQVESANERNAHLSAQLEALQQRYAGLDREHATLNSTLEQKQWHFSEQQQLLKESRDQLKLEFEQLAAQIFEAKGQAFSQQNQQSLDALLKPFREQIDGFRAKVEDIHHKDVQQQATLAQQLVQLNELNRQITQEAHDLANALKGQKKMQGNWGELILENVLERSGLVAGRDFVREASFTTSEGRKRPDALVYLPQGKHLIIDAKVSLNAYTRYVNSEDDTERRLALAEHVSAISMRIRELADRHYFDLPGLNAPEMVFMFIPIESAFVEALKADETLFQKAIERNVLVATPTTLLTSLNIVRQLWRFEDQNRHTAELADRAGKVYDKLRTFLGSMDNIEASLDRARDAYGKARDQLVGGRGNLVKQVAEFRDLGIAVKGELSESWVDPADLELGLIERQEG